MSEREDLTRALQGKRVREAARIAGKLARADAWDNVVAATLHQHGRPGAPEHEQARSWLAVVLAAARLQLNPRSTAAVAEVLEQLVAAGRVSEARVGLRLGTRAGLLDADAWLGVALALLARGLSVDSLEVVEEAVAGLPPSARLWAVVAQLRLGAGRWRGARVAAKLSKLLDPGGSTPHLVLAALRARAGDKRGHARHLEEARRLGVPAVLAQQVAFAAPAG